MDFARSPGKREGAQPDEQCLAWLHACAEGSAPVLLYSGGALDENASSHILARDPSLVVQGRLFGPDGGHFSVEDRRASTAPVQHDWSELFDVLRALEREHGQQLPPPAQRPRPFGGGWVVALGYDLAWLFEYGLPRYLPPSSPLPDLWLAWYDDPLCVDRATGEAQGSASMLAEWRAAEPGATPSFTCEARTCAFHREDYEAAVERVREHCQAGDLFQADLSRRLEYRFEGAATALFARLVEASPAPFMAYLGLGHGRSVVSASPEEYLRLRGRELRSQPIKGTRPRAGDAAGDAAQRRALLASEKDLAELTMIVDLVRNDLGRVARAGSVHVSDFPQLMRLPQVWHLSADVRAELDEDRDVWDAIGASFPPGSIVGAPKPMALEILERVERTRRGVYTGGVGYIEAAAGSDGVNAHLNVAIRSAELGDGRLRFGVGGGITALSDPSEEFEETCDKARGFDLALGLEQMLDQGLGRGAEELDAD